MRNVLERAAVAACASAALSATLWAQTPPTDAANGARAPEGAASAGEVPGPRTPDAPGTRPLVLGTRTPPAAPVPGVRPQAPTDTTPPATVQTPTTRPRPPSDHATPPATAPSNVGRGVPPSRANPSRATDPSNPIDPAAADPSKPADPTRPSPRGDAGSIGEPLMRVAARDARATDPLLDARSHVLDAPPHSLAACMRDHDRAVRARCAHDATAPDAHDGAVTR